jgi:hypothetical protein
VLIEELRHGNAPLAEALASFDVTKVRGVRMQQQMAEALAKTQEKLGLDALYARIAKDARCSASCYCYCCWSVAPHPSATPAPLCLV